MNAKAANQNILEIIDLSVVYHGRQQVYAVRELNCTVSSSEFLCILGTSGCGKSTILNVIAGFITPTSGKVLMYGNEVREPGADRGIVFQRHALFPWKTVRGNIEFGLKMKGLDKVERDKIANKYIQLIGLESFQDSYPCELSGGMEQRVGIARVLANNPSILLMDEPFGSLDAQTRMMMQELLMLLWENLKNTVIFVTHDVDEAILLSDRLLVLTASPATVKKEIFVNLPRPRTYKTMLTSDFIKIKEEVISLIREETIKAMA